MEPTREDAWLLLKEYTDSENLIRHAIAVEAAMRAYASKFDEDEERWGITGLLHDFDYERFPDEHPCRGATILEEKGFPPEIIHAIQSHADYTGVPRQNRMDKALFEVDELTGFITAVTLVRPGRRIRELPVKSVKKKMKDKAFARSVNREDIRQGAAELGISLDEHIAFVIQAMSRVAPDLELE